MENTVINSYAAINLDFIYYLIYLFFKSIKDFFIPDPDTSINIVQLMKYTSDGNTITDPDKYGQFGNGIGSLYDGYSLFSPPHGLSDFGGISGWIDNFFNNPYCDMCQSFFDLFFGGLNTWLWFFIFVSFICLTIIKSYQKEHDLNESILYDIVYEKQEKTNKDSREAYSKKWQIILDLIASENKNDWRLAIIDADNLMEKLLDKRGFDGVSVGERLKSSNLKSIDAAWEAHKVRNQIAHNQDFTLTQREAKIAISNFSKVFSEITD